MTATGTRKDRTLIQRTAREMWDANTESPVEPAPRIGRTPLGAGDLTHSLLVKVTILAAGYWTIRVLQGVM